MDRRLGSLQELALCEINIRLVCDGRALGFRLFCMSFLWPGISMVVTDC
jgi:hypothetical protein